MMQFYPPDLTCLTNTIVLEHKNNFSDWYYIPKFHYPENKPITRKISFVGSWSELREKNFVKN